MHDCNEVITLYIHYIYSVDIVHLTNKLSTCDNDQKGLEDPKAALYLKQHPLNRLKDQVKY